MQTITLQSLPQSVVPDPANILMVDDAERWFRALHAAGLMFHPEDDPASIGNTINGQWVPLFDAPTAVLIRAWMDQVWKVKGFDPCGFALSLMDGEEQTEEKAVTDLLSTLYAMLSEDSDGNAWTGRAGALAKRITKLLDEVVAGM